MDARLVRSLVSAEDPSSRVIGPWLARTTTKVGRSAAPRRLRTLISSYRARRRG
jgi:hypothetical protein